MTITLKLDEEQVRRLFEVAHEPKVDPYELAKAAIVANPSARPNWIEFVAAPLIDKEQQAMQRSISRGVPFGDDT